MKPGKSVGMRSSPMLPDQADNYRRQYGFSSILSLPSDTTQCTRNSRLRKEDVRVRGCRKPLSQRKSTLKQTLLAHRYAMVTSQLFNNAASTAHRTLDENEEERPRAEN